MQRLPLFPLNTVLFPGAQLPLHVFEQRYRLLIGRCIQENKPFGVVLIREGAEVGGAAVPHLVGTLAEIETAYRLDDGRMYVTAVGRQRFHINYPLTAEPYLVGMVSLLEDPPGTPALAAGLLAMCERYRRTVSATTGMRVPPFDLPADPLSLSFGLAHLMQVSPPKRQKWLEQTTDERLSSLHSTLEHELSSWLPPLDPALLDREPPFDSTSWN